MSNSKKLTYTMEEPAFLARLRSAAAGAGRQERHIAPRNRKAVREDDEEDAPAYVLEETGEALSREEFILLGGRGGEKEEEKEEGEEKVGEKDGEGEKVAAQVVAEAGMKRKRKAAKIIGADEEEEKEKEKEDKKPPSPAKKKVKAKRKVKLSFGDDE
jgi:hypothetical protein